MKKCPLDGIAIKGHTRAPRKKMQAGGYLGGLKETGRGTMAGELGPKGVCVEWKAEGWQVPIIDVTTIRISSVCHGYIRQHLF